MNKHSHRKDEHVIIAEKLYTAESQNGLSQIRLLPLNIPELTLAEIDLHTNFLGYSIEYPFFINAMTGGSVQTGKLNAKLARVAAITNIPMATGSQSIALSIPETKASFEIVRQENPQGLVLGNLGAHHNLSAANRAVKMLNADALELHLNVAQELVMPEGDIAFKWLANISDIVNNLSVPVLVKEVGTGITPKTLHFLQQTNVKYVDLSGYGGTNFVKIENERRKNKELAYFDELTITTAEALIAAQAFKTDFSFTASGGIRNALDIVKCLVLGADNVGISGQFLHILIKNGEDGLISFIEELKQQIRQLMLLLGCQNISELRQVQYILSPCLLNFKNQLS